MSGRKVKFPEESFILMENMPAALPDWYWHSEVCVCVWVCVADMQGSGGESRQAQAAGVEDEVLQIMEQKMLYNLFSISTVFFPTWLLLPSSNYKIAQVSR